MSKFVMYLNGTSYGDFSKNIGRLFHLLNERSLNMILGIYEQKSPFQDEDMMSIVVWMNLEDKLIVRTPLSILKRLFKQKSFKFIEE
jgi:hypothetical protein